VSPLVGRSLNGSSHEDECTAGGDADTATVTIGKESTANQS
jgi:hypothetical protein